MSDIPGRAPCPNVLIVDDMPANLHALMQILSERGYRARPVSNGPAALVAARAAPPDLILLDILMPDIDGYTVCAALKADERTRDIPVIYMSALSDTEDKLKAFEAGGVDYITKPFHAEEVLARVETHLKLRDLQRQLEQRVQELQEALDQVRTLRGLLPICARCKKIRDDSGYWHQVEEYLEVHTQAQFTHGLCPECSHALYPELWGSGE